MTDPALARPLTRQPLSDVRTGGVSALTYLSLGWGWQSWTLVCMMALGELPRTDRVVHADTTHERAATYEFARRWTPWLAERGIEVVTVSGARTDVTRPDWGIGAVMIPAFSVSKADGTWGQVKRQCTHDWKIMPIRRYIREEMRRQGIKRAPGSVESWMGISTDEWQRMRTSDVAYISNVYPLVDRGMTRADCRRWLEAHGLPVPPKSACTFCPYHGLDAWRDLKRQGGRDWKEAVHVDQEIRGMRDDHVLYVHPRRRPLDEDVQPANDDGVLAREYGLEQPCDSGYCWT